MSVKLEIKRNSRISYDENGYQVERVAIVSGITGNADAMLYNALQESGLPAYGDPHPVVPEVKLQKMVADPIAGGKFRVTMTYAEDDDNDETASAVLSSSLATEETAFDINGELIVVKYSLQSFAGTYTRYQPLDVQRPQTRVSLTRTELEIPKDYLDKYLGRINSVEWSGFPAQTWLCSGINAREEDDEFEIEYVFDYREDTWKGVVVLPVSARTDGDLAQEEEIVIDPDTGQGYSEWDVYETANFNNMGISF